jgi:hypothetical protein
MESQPFRSWIGRTFLFSNSCIEQEEDERDTWLCAFRELIGSIVVLESPLSSASLACLLRVPRDEVKCQLDSLHSVLSVPDSEDVPIRLLHLSFREFLVNPQKQGKNPSWVDEKSTHQKLAFHCLELMSGPSGLRRNMCNLPGPGVRRSEIDEETIASSLSPDLQYACRYWVSHLKQSQHDIVDGDTTHIFLQKHLLHWLEVMSLMRESSQCVHLLDSLQALTGVGSIHNLSWYCANVQDSRLQPLFEAFYTTLSDLCYGSSLCSQMRRCKSIAPHSCSHQREVWYDKLLWTKCQRGLRCCL